MRAVLGAVPSLGAIGLAVVFVVVRAALRTGAEQRGGPEITRAAGRPASFEGASDTVVELVTMIASDGEGTRFGKDSPHPRSYGTVVRCWAATAARGSCSRSRRRCTR